MRMRLNIAMIAALLALATPAFAAQNREDREDREDRKDEPVASTKPEAGSAAVTDGGEAATKEEVRALAAELRRLKLEMGLGDTEYRSYEGMGPAASKVYFAPKGLAIGGYGETYYRNYLEDDRDDSSDLYRVVLYAGYRFTPTIVFNAEVEFEHQDELAVEFAYLDFLLSDAVRLRVGNMLVPIGFVNEMHEPAFFNGVFRPALEQDLIPSTWNENGVGVHGAVAGLRYKAYALVGLNATNGAVTPSRWLRNARTGGGESPAESFAGVLNLNYDLGLATVGGTVYGGRAGQGVETAGGESIDANVLLAEAHAQVAWQGFTARAIYAIGRLGDARQISELALGEGETLDPDQVVGSRTRGGYVEVAYDVMPLLSPESVQSLSPFVRFESLDLHADVPSGFERNGAFQNDYLVAGLTYRPIPQVVLKGDWQRRTPGEGDAVDQVNVGAGFIF
jgi:hypothetical protein